MIIFRCRELNVKKRLFSAMARPLYSALKVLKDHSNEVDAACGML